MTMIDTADSRFAKAVAIADGAGQWLRLRCKNGEKRYGVPSSKDSERFYVVGRSSCDCEDARRHPGQLCKHSLACQIHCARVAGPVPTARVDKPMPASDTVDGLEQMVSARHPVLDMIREPDGSIRWERARPRPPLPAETIRLAGEYERVYGSL